jgi:hypothetical protein
MKTTFIGCLLTAGGFALGYGLRHQGPAMDLDASRKLITALQTEVRKAEESIDAKDKQLGELWLSDCKVKRDGK